MGAEKDGNTYGARGGISMTETADNSRLIELLDKHDWNEAVKIWKQEKDNELLRERRGCIDRADGFIRRDSDDG